MSGHPLVPADRVNGTAVFDSAGQKLGHVEDIAIDKVSGRVAYAILSFGGFLGVGEHYYPVPWSLLDYDVEKGGYVVPLDKAKVEAAPSFEAKELSGWSDKQARDEIFGYYSAFGVAPYWI